jgi:hypothetical protein
MLKKIFSWFVFTALVSGAAVLGYARPADRQLMSQLPASDVVAGVDLQRLQAETIPAFGAVKPKILEHVNREIAKFQEETGIDPRVFESAALGLNLKNKNGGEAVVLLQGRFNASELIEKGYAAAARKDAKMTREARQFEGFNIWLIGKSNSRPGVFALDSNTVAFGEWAGLQNLISARLGRAGRVSEDLLNLATRNPAALVTFGGELPKEMLSRVGGRELDAFASLENIRRFAGSFNTVGLNVDAELNLVTETGDQANELRDAFNGLRMLFGGFRMGGAAARKGGPDFGKILKSVQISANGNEVQMRVNLQEEDVRGLLGAL